MVTARLHDGSPMEVTVLGDGPAVVLPVSMIVREGAEAEHMRAWGADPNVGPTLATGLADAGFRVIAADYESHLAEHPKSGTLTADAVATDLLAVADAADAHRFAYYGYSWLALAGLQLAIRTDRLTALAMGGYPPLDGPYAAMLTVTRAGYRLALARDGQPPVDIADVQPGDWDSAEVTVSPDQVGQYVTLYESLRDFDERAALDRLDVPRLAFAGENDNITYGADWDNAYVAIADPLRAHRDELVKRGWTVQILPGKDHMGAMHGATVLAILAPWLAANCP